MFIIGINMALANVGGKSSAVMLRWIVWLNLPAATSVILQ